MRKRKKEGRCNGEKENSIPLRYLLVKQPLSARICFFSVAPPFFLVSSPFFLARNDWQLAFVGNCQRDSPSLKACLERSSRLCSRKPNEHSKVKEMERWRRRRGRTQLNKNSHGCFFASTVCFAYLLASMDWSTWGRVGSVLFSYFYLLLVTTRPKGGLAFELTGIEKKESRSPNQTPLHLPSWIVYGWTVFMHLASEE